MDKQSTTRIYGLIGYPVEHSFSPLIHNTAFEALGINAEYRLFEIKPQDLNAFLQGDLQVTDTQGRVCRAQDVEGFNITIPHKVGAFKFIRYTTIIQPPTDITFLLVDAVNTVKRDRKGIHYYNTDIIGFTNALRQDLKFDISGRSVFLFGCGGAGKAVLASLLQNGMNVNKIYVYDIDKKVMDAARNHFFEAKFAEIVGQRLEFIGEKQIEEKIGISDLVVNASPVGMNEGDSSVIDKNLLRKELYVYDLVYNRKTQLIKDAESRGVRKAVNGLGMLLYQGIASFEIWRSPIKVPPEIVKQIRNKLDKAIYRCL